MADEITTSSSSRAAEQIDNAAQQEPAAQVANVTTARVVREIALPTLKEKLVCLVTVAFGVFAMLMLLLQGNSHFPLQITLDGQPIDLSSRWGMLSASWSWQFATSCPASRPRTK